MLGRRSANIGGCAVAMLLPGRHHAVANPFLTIDAVIRADHVKIASTIRRLIIANTGSDSASVNSISFQYTIATSPSEKIIER